MAEDIIQTGEENFVVRNNKEILQILNNLIKEGTSLKIAFNQGEEDYFTHMIDIDPQNNLLYFDMTVDHQFNQRLFASPEIVILKDTGIRIKWKSVQHTMITLLDGNALRVEIPNTIIRLQRRELFRLKTPMNEPIPCEISVPDIVNPNKKAAIKYNIVDVSLGGVGLIVKDELHPSIVVGALFDNCVINFPEAGKTELKLEVRNIVPLSDASAEKYRIGLGFVRPNRSMESIIHKYTFNLERSILAARNRNE
jgi:c-di-GMP-binding flagellar brake protein YcgR